MGMKKILVLPYGPALSHVSRAMEVAKGLRVRQHEVIFASDGDFMRLPREEGFRVLPLKVLDQFVLAGKTHHGRMDWYDDATVAEHVAAELKLLGEIKPDLVLSDFRLTAGTSAELAGIPHASILNASWTNYCSAHSKAPKNGSFLFYGRLMRRILSRCARPFDRLRRAKKLAGEGTLSDIRKCVALIAECAEFGPRMGIRANSPYVWELNTGAEPLNRFRRARNLAGEGNLFDAMKGDITLMADCPEFGPTRDLPANFHYVGPITWEPQIDTPAWLGKLDSSRPTIYVSMGASGYYRVFDLMAYLFGDTAYQCVMTTANLPNPSSYPANFFVTDYAAGRQILRKSDLMICQGGNGTIYQALSCGVPLICIPTHGDQYNNSLRVAELGLGIHLTDIARLKHSVAEILNAPRYRENARKFAAILQSYNGPETAAARIHEFLDGGTANAETIVSGKARYAGVKMASFRR